MSRGVEEVPYIKYSSADIALLEDLTKRQVYMEAHSSCIVPRYCEITTILSTKSALIEPPPPSFLDGAFPGGGVDWTKFSGGTLSFHMINMASFASAWVPVERRWEAGGAPALMHSSTLPYIIILPCLWMETSPLAAELLTH